MCRYAYCPNLTIIDTPGFILKVSAPCLPPLAACLLPACITYDWTPQCKQQPGMERAPLPTCAANWLAPCPMQAKNGEADSTPDEIMQMVKAQAAPKHRCVSSVAAHLLVPPPLASTQYGKGLHILAWVCPTPCTG